MERSWLNNNISSILHILDDAKVDYNPTTYYYTPTTPIPRSLTSQNFVLDVTDISCFDTVVYVHIPFCSRRCSFCPFFLDINNSVPDNFVIAIKKQIKQISTKFILPKKISLYFWWWTPSLLSVSQLEEIISCFNAYCIQEITLEVHPEIYKHNSNYFKEIAQLWVNRISVGLQSSEKEILNYSARGHDVVSFYDIVSEIKNNMMSVSIDVMFGGLFKETISSTEQTFEYVFGELKPDWVTAYQVCIQWWTLEKNRYNKYHEQYPSIEDILYMRSLRQHIAKKNNYQYLFGDYFSLQQEHPKYKTKRRWEKSAVIWVWPWTHSYIIDTEEKWWVNWYAPFDIKQYLQCIQNKDFVVDRWMMLSSDYVYWWSLITSIKKNWYVKIEKQNTVLSSLTKIGLLKQQDAVFSLTEKGVLLEDLIYAVLLPVEMWKSFYRQKQEKNYSLYEKYDWFFDPKTVFDFYSYLVSL